MSDALEKVGELKNVARTERSRGRREDAVKILENAIDLLERSMHTGDRSLQAHAARELADLYGTLGGTLREQGNLVRAAAAYDAGFRLESDPRYGICSSYNAVNRLYTRILLCPRSLANPDALRDETALEFVDIPQELTALRAKLERELGGARLNDYWAASDLAMICALLGDDEGAARAAAQFADGSPPAQAYESCLKALDALGSLDTPRKQSLERLESRVSISARG